MGSLKDSVVSEFKNMKFRVKDAEHSKQIQEYLFSLGYKWSSLNQKTQHTDALFLFVGIKGFITHEQDDNKYFEKHKYIEYQLKETKSYSLEEVKPIKTIAALGIDLNVEVTVNGEKISLKDLKELLNKE